MNWYKSSLKTYDYSTCQVNLDESISNKIKDFAKQIPDEELAEDGRESEIHITVKYGLHTDDPEDVERIVSDVGTIKATLGKTSLFESEDNDVLKIDIDSKDLYELNEMICEDLEYTDSHPEYIPHVTIAYLKKGKGKQYSGDDFMDGVKLSFDDVVFGSKKGEKQTISLL